MKQVAEQLDRTRNTLFNFVESATTANIFEILKVIYHNERMYLLIEKKWSPRLEVEDTLVVVDMEDEKDMGMFTVSEIRRDDYYAVATDNVDPVWKGYVRQQDKLELESPPHTYAILTPHGAEQ